ncbi:uncharacterized protein ARMOST_21902 [Armillaria ostoyae]|uniref:Uncharacterized protein n=1 Tax=Armillaria ostoyae TaxID=47428 RepID=A0A284SBG3_ARMOS|nr:uncharacterized protein ARMOST_21902 [Armillaria ostoyae]
MVQVSSSKQAGKAVQSAVDVDVLLELILSMRLDREQTYELVDALLQADDFEAVAAAAMDGEADHTTDDDKGPSSTSRCRHTPHQEMVAPTPAPALAPVVAPVVTAVAMPVSIPVAAPVAPVIAPAPARAPTPIVAPVPIPIATPVIAPVLAPIPIPVTVPIITPVPVDVLSNSEWQKTSGRK